MAEYRVLKEADLPLETVILLLAGMTMLIAGGLLLAVSAGNLPYYENGLYGLLMVIFALQVITLGRTPFGDMRRSKPLLAAGVAIASAGIVTCFIPDIFGRIPRLLLFTCFGPGGFLLLLQMCFAKAKLPAWMKYGGIFRRLIVGCAAVYGLSMLIALLIWQQSLLTTPLTAAAVLVYGAAIVYLAWVLRDVYRLYPQAATPRPGAVELSPEQAMLLVMGIFMLLLGVLLIPVNLGLLPFAGGAQLGLLMVMFAVQMLAAGSTPLGPFRRTWLMILFGLLFAALGIVSCIIPEILVPALTLLVGLLNVLGGAVALGKICLSRLQKPGQPASAGPPILTKLFVTQVVLDLLSILFGASMFVPWLIPGLAAGVILAANGGVLLYLLRILTVLDKLQSAAYSTST